MLKFVYDISTWARPQIQCDQIGRFIAHWATFQSLWERLFYPKCPHFKAIFVKLSKSFIFLVEIIFEQLLKTFGNFLLVTLSTPMDNRMTLTTFIESHSFKIKPSRSLAVQSKFCNKSRCCKTAQSNFISNKSVNHFKREAPRHNLTLD